MNIQQLVQNTLDFFQNQLNKQASIIGASRVETGWQLEVETIEDSEYLRKRGQDDMMAVYQVQVDDAGGICGFERVGLRVRGKAEFTKDE